MKALVKMQEGAGNWAVIDKPEPNPGEGQVKIKVEYIGICGLTSGIFSKIYGN